MEEVWLATSQAVGHKSSEPWVLTMKIIKLVAALVVLACLAPSARSQASDWVVYQGKEGPGQGKHIVFVTGDEEYRSEEGMPMLARILAVRHGFKCTVLFAINPTNGTIDPLNPSNILGLKNLDTADMMVVFTRFRELPDDQMKYFVDYVNSGKPIIGLRTATHAFSYTRNKQSPYAKYDWRDKAWPGGFGQQVLGETWVNHHGVHLEESTRGVINDALKNHPILRASTTSGAPPTSIPSRICPRMPRCWSRGRCSKA